MMDCIYCFSEESLPGAFRLSTADLGTPFALEIICRVDKADEKLPQLQRLLDRYVPLIQKDTYRLSREELLDFVALIGQVESPIALSPAPQQMATTGPLVYWWDLKKCFTDGQPIRHRVSTHHTLIGEFRNGQIEYYSSKFRSLRDFARYHYRNFSPYWTENDFLNGWYECECKVQGEWKYAYTVAQMPMPLMLASEQRVRHCIGENIWFGVYERGAVLHSSKRYENLQHFSVSHVYSAKSTIDSPSRLEAEVQNEWYPIQP